MQTDSSPSWMPYRFIRHFAKFPKTSTTRQRVRKEVFRISLFSRKKAVKYLWQKWREEVLAATARSNAALGDLWRPTSPYLWELFKEFGPEIFRPFSSARKEEVKTHA